MKCPKYAQIDNNKYEINTSFRTAIKCNEIAMDKNISNYERPLAIIYLLFGDKGLKDKKNHQKLFEIALKYLRCGEEKKETNEEPDMDYVQDMDLIEASFMSDFHIDLANTDMDWYKFNNLINGLSSSELGNSCILNRVRSLRTYDVSKIKDNKERRKIIEAKKRVALKKNKKEPTQKQRESAKRLYERLGLKKE